MEPEAFDWFVRELRIGSRRSLLGSVATGLVAAMTGAGPAFSAPVGCVATGRKCRHGRDCCSGQCDKHHHRCRHTTNPDPSCAGGAFCCPAAGCQLCGAEGAGCSCATTTEGGGMCLSEFPCGDSCVRSADCGKDAVCVDATTGETACCSGTNTCVPYTLRCAVAATI